MRGYAQGRALNPRFALAVSLPLLAATRKLYAVVQIAQGGQVLVAQLKFRLANLDFDEFREGHLLEGSVG